MIAKAAYSKYIVILALLQIPGNGEVVGERTELDRRPFAGCPTDHKRQVKSWVLNWPNWEKTAHLLATHPEGGTRTHNIKANKN